MSHQTSKSNKDYPERITKADKNMVNDLDYDGLVYPDHISDRTFEDCIYLLLITEGGRSHYGYIKDFNRFMYNKTKCKPKKHFWKYCLHCFSGGRVWAEHIGT